MLTCAEGCLDCPGRLRKFRRRQTGGMDLSPRRVIGSAPVSLRWVESLGGPLVAVPVSALAEWAGAVGSEDDDAAGDDYERACGVDGLVGVLGVGPDGAQALVLADEPARSCYLPERRLFLRWLGADSDADLLAAAEGVLTDPAVVWDECGLWETDGDAVLIDSVSSGAELDVEYVNGGLPEQEPVRIGAGRWRVRAVHVSGEFVGLDLFSCCSKGERGPPACRRVR
jgi:hypothetical protein